MLKGQFPASHLLLCPSLHLMTASINKPTDIFRNTVHKSMGMHLKQAINQRYTNIFLVNKFLVQLIYSHASQ
jgi:hypothetical protein